MNAVARTLAAVKAAQSTEVTWTVVDTTMPPPPTKQAWGVQHRLAQETTKATRPDGRGAESSHAAQYKLGRRRRSRSGEDGAPTDCKGTEGRSPLGRPPHPLVRPAGLRQGFAGCVPGKRVGPRRFGDGPRGRVAFEFSRSKARPRGSTTELGRWRLACCWCAGWS